MAPILFCEAINQIVFVLKNTVIEDGAHSSVECAARIAAYHVNPRILVQQTWWLLWDVE